MSGCSEEMDDKSCFFCLKLQPLSKGRSKSGSDFCLADVLSFIEIFYRDGNLNNSDDLRRNFQQLLNQNQSSTARTCKECSKIGKEFMDLYSLIQATKQKAITCLKRMHEVMSKAESEMEMESSPIAVAPKKKRRDSRGRGRCASFPRTSALRSETIELLQAVVPRHSHPEPVISKGETGIEEECQGEATVKREVDVDTTDSDSGDSCIPPDSSADAPFDMEVKQEPEDEERHVKSKTSQFRIPTEDEHQVMDLGGTSEDIDRLQTLPSSSTSASGCSLKDVGNDNDVVPRHEKESTSFPRKKGKRRRQSTSEETACSLCRAQFYKNSLLRLHMAQYHCSEFFPNHKLDSVTDSQFQKILVELLFNFKDMDSSSGNGKNKICPYCPHSLRLHDPKVFRMHLISSHYGKLEKKLLEIQSDPNLSSTLDGINPHGRFCDCGMYVQSAASQAAHGTFHCILATEEQLSANQASRKKDHSFIENFTTVTSGEGGVEKVQCKLCNTIVNRASARNHWNISCGKGTHQRRRVPKVYGHHSKYTKACIYCNYECSDNITYHGGMMQSHLVRFHPEHFFQKEKQEASTSRITITHQQFLKLIADILLPECVEISGSLVSCSFCSMSWGSGSQNHNYHRSKMHLLNRHGSELRQRLGMIMGDPNLEERLEDCNPGGEFCPCGVYLPNKLGNDSKAHRKYCKLKSEEKECSGSEDGDSTEEVTN